MPEPLQAGAVLFHRRYLQLVEQIERNFPVAQWKARDLEIWPLARMDLYLDLYRHSVGIAPVPSRPLALRALDRYAGPVMNAWRSRHDLHHWVARPRPADALLLGDGVSLDRIDGEWRDRYGDPLIAALASQGRSTFLMQQSDLSRLPWHRPTYAANVIARRGRRRSSMVKARLDLPEHARALEFLAANGIASPSMQAQALVRRAHIVLATASAFEAVLRVVRPRLAFVVTYYAELGPAFLLACRRHGILSVDLQHCPQDGAHKAYGWFQVPEHGYAALPAVFWNWTEADAAYIEGWTKYLGEPWHRSIHGGHTQLASYLDDNDPTTKALDARFEAIAGGARYEREILIALQPVSGYRAQWDALAAQIETAPSQWRWWIRRHPASRAYQDEEYTRLVALRRPNVIVDASLSVPLPTLLRHMSVAVSRYSGSSAEAAMFGVPALFLSDEARDPFSGLLARGTATVVDIPRLNDAIARLPAAPVRPPLESSPKLHETLACLDGMAGEYARLCQDTLTSRRNVSERRSSSL
jgi:hypothetical protein